MPPSNRTSAAATAPAGTARISATARSHGALRLAPSPKNAVAARPMPSAITIPATIAPLPVAVAKAPSAAAETATPSPIITSRAIASRRTTRGAVPSPPDSPTTSVFASDACLGAAEEPSRGLSPLTAR